MAQHEKAKEKLETDFDFLTVESQKLDKLKIFDFVDYRRIEF